MEVVILDIQNCYMYNSNINTQIAPQFDISKSKSFSPCYFCISTNTQVREKILNLSWPVRIKLKKLHKLQKPSNYQPSPLMIKYVG